ncbi:hypothetical protein DFH06DRAFT_347026 [Mycena polygramma]|nr:hypothetical protein DFH06DRAFT_347026 [Mycena polygramma]
MLAMFSRGTRLCGIHGDLLYSLASSYLTPPAHSLTPSPMALPRDPLQTVIRDVVLYPVDGSEPRIIQRSFSQYGASQHFFPHAVDIELGEAYGAENMAGTCAKVLEPGLPVHPYAHYVVYHNISPDLPVNLALARVLGVAPQRLGHPLLWRGDVFVIRRGHSAGPGQGTRLDNLHVLSDAIEVLNTLIPRWYHSDEWATFHQEELIRNRLQQVNSPRRRIYAERIAMLEQLINYSKVPNYTKFLERDVFLFPADGGDPRIVRRWLGPPVEDRRPYGSQHYGIELDLRAIYGLENMFALRRISLDGRLKGYAMYFNLSPTLPLNLAMAKAVGVNPENPGMRLLWRGDVVIVKWDHAARGTTIKATDMKSQDALRIVDAGLIPRFYTSVSWQDLLHSEEQFDKHWRKGNQSVDRRRACEWRGWFSGSRAFISHIYEPMNVVRSNKAHVGALRNWKHVASKRCSVSFSCVSQCSCHYPCYCAYYGACCCAALRTSYCSYCVTRWLSLSACLPTISSDWFSSE